MPFLTTHIQKDDDDYKVKLKEFWNKPHEGYDPFFEINDCEGFDLPLPLDNNDALSYSIVPTHAGKDSGEQSFALYLKSNCLVDCELGLHT